MKGTSTRGTLSGWSVTNAPRNFWQNYLRAPFNGNYTAYIPSLRLFIDKPGNPNNEVVADQTGFGSAISFGVDCVGFAERAASYNGSTYLWKFDNDPSCLDTADNATTRVLLQSAHTGYFSPILDQTTYNKPETTPEVIREIASRIMPGDICFYDGHIGIIQDVSGIPTGVVGSKNAVLSGIKTIESVYSGRIGFVESRKFSEFVDDKEGWAIVRLKHANQ